jgi:hypothetical protein
MKFNFRKVSALGAGLLMATMTAGIAAASAYPAPFIEGGSANVAIVYGTGAGVSVLDAVEAGNIQSNLQSKMGTSVGTTSSVSGEAKSLASGTSLLYLLDDLAENVATITKDDLPTVLADGDFVDNDGGSWKYTQTIAMGTSETNRLSFGNSDNDIDDPTVMLEMATAATSPMYTWTLDFSKATNLNATISEGEELSIFGKTYTVGTATDGDTIVLLGGSSAQKVYVGETVTMDVNDISYDVSLDGLSSATTTQASITVNGESKTFTQGQTKTYVFGDAEIEVYAKTVFRTGDDGSGHVEIELGADKLTLEDGNAVQYGSDNTDIDQTVVALTGTANNVVGSITKITIAVAAEDSDANHILVGDSFTDPVFGTLKLELNSVGNGPTFEAEDDTGRTRLDLVSGGSRELQVTMTDDSGVTKTIPFAYNKIMQDDSNNPFITVEGNNLTDDDYFILNSGDYEHLMKVTKMNIALNAATSDVEIQDVFTGTKYLVENKDFTGGQNVTINSQTYTITNTTAAGGAYAGVNITRAGADLAEAGKRSLFPYIELVAGEDFPRVAFVNTTNLIKDATGDILTVTANATAGTGRTYEVPTGSIQFRLTDNCIENGVTCATNTSFLEAGSTPTGGTVTWANVTGYAQVGSNHNLTVGVGEGYYIFGAAITNPVTGTSVTFKNVTLDLGFTTTYAVTDRPLAPVVMFIEDKDKSDADARNVIVINTSDDGTYSEQTGDVLFSGSSQYDSENWDDTKYKGYLTNYGTYAVRDQTDTNINLARLSYGTAQMYADVYMAEAEASITAGSTGGASQLGDVLVKDSEVSSVSSKNLVIVGGSCINSAAATLIGGAHCGAGFTDATGVGAGQFIIKGYDSSSLTSKLALLVAGYDAADTVNAATYLRTKATDTSKEYLGTSSTSAELVVA